MNDQTCVPVGSTWRHWKGGQYVVIATGFLEWNGEGAVVYQSDTTGVVWVRTVSNLLGKVKDEVAARPSVDRFVRVMPEGAGV